MEVKVKDRPILFSAEMVRAILAGRKSVTRRIMKPQPFVNRHRITWWPKNAKLCDGQMRPMAMWRTGMPIEKTGAADIGKLCPYGTRKERLWVRETWQSLWAMNQCHPGDDQFVYRATDPDWDSMDGWKWRPSIFMPREASRITLEVTNASVERLHDISEEDAIAEGCQCAGVPGSLTSREAYAKLWEAINGKGSWETNPWVWVIEFKRI
jgi:hypothetical protein